LIGAAGSAVQVGVLRAGAWTARGLRVPARNALLADLTTPEVYGRAYGFERAMDNLGAILGPLLALVLVSLVGTRTAIYLSVIPGLLATLAIVYAIEHRRRTRTSERVPICWQLRPVLRGGLGHLMVGIGAFEVGNVAATLLILRATELLDPGRSHDRAVQLALVLYIAYNVAATLTSVPAGHLGDRHGQIRVLVVGVVLFAAAYGGFAVGPDGLVLLGVCFVLAGLAIGCVETAEHAAVAHSAALDLRGSAFGILAAVQSFGNLAASAIAGILWTAVSPTAAFVYLCAWMLVAFVALVTRPRRHRQQG
jgi:MFS family permease